MQNNMSKAKRIKLEPPERSCCTSMYPILADNLTEDTPLIDVFVDKIKDPRKISQVVINLNSVLPIPELSHLKRVKSGEIILFSIGNMPQDQIHDFLKTKHFDITLLSNNIRIATVAGIPPKTKKQFARVNELWPCNFHSDKYIEKLSTNTLFSNSEVRDHEKYMDIAIEVAILAQKLNITHHNQGIIIVDPKLKSVVALGYSEADKSPYKHAPIVAIDNVAKTQNGGAWTSYEPQKSGYDLNMCGIHPAFLPFLQEKFPDIKFGASWFKGKSEIIEPSDGPYLCTNYYVYSSHEPCIMCAMALIHSRVKRVFYGSPTSKGGLETLCKIHTVKDLNHHYEVFARLCEDKCKGLEMHHVSL